MKPSVLGRGANKLLLLHYLHSERKEWYRDFAHFRSYAQPVLTSKQKKQVKAYFGRYGLKTRTDWHNYYTFMTGHFSEKYIPADIMYTTIVPYLNYMPFELAYQDKNNYEAILPCVEKPKTIMKRKHGFYEVGGRIANFNAAIEICSNLKEAIIKPTINSCQGRDVKLFSTTNGKLEDGRSIEQFLAGYGEDFIVQERVRQHPFLMSLNESSLNTMRILTLRIENDIQVLSSAIRIGGKGSITDNGYGGGFCTGLNMEGKLHPQGYRLTTGEHINQLQNGRRLEGLKVPNFDKVIEKTKECALMLPYLRIIGWDFTLDEAGNPVFIEMNTLPGIYIMQLCNGPVFGDLTDALLKSVSTVHHQFQPRMIRQYSNRLF